MNPLCTVDISDTTYCPLEYDECLGEGCKYFEVVDDEYYIYLINRGII